MPFAATWMDPEIITLSEISQTEKVKGYVLYNCIYIIFLKQQHFRNGEYISSCL